MSAKSIAAVLGLLLAIFALPAKAALTFCNKADVMHTFAVAFKVEAGWQVEGWWNIEPGDCKVVVGGDLKNRYYYWRAKAKGRDFTGEDFYFCTKTEAFTIVGEQGNCALRNLDSHEFSKLDTGKSAKDFTLNLVLPDSAAGPDTASDEDQEPLIAGEAGSYGDPYANDAIFQECLEEGDAEWCAFHADGTKFYVYQDGRTPDDIFDFMRKLLPGDPIAVEGDLVEVFDSTAEVVLRVAAGRRGDARDVMIGKMQGYWYATDDPNARFNILGAERINDYDGEMMGTEFISLRDNCDDFSGGGPYLYARDPEGGDSLCYEVVSVSDLEMVLMYLPRGNFLEYRKLD